MAAAPFFVSPGSSWAPSWMGRRFAPYKRFGLAQNLGAGAIHLPRASKINLGHRRKLQLSVGLLGDVAQYLGKDAFFNLK